jgi:cytochrome P450 family 6
MFPKLKIFGTLKFSEADVEKFFVDLVMDTIDYREKNDVKRNDFMQLMIQMKNEGYKSVDQPGEKNDDDELEYFKEKSLSGNQKLTINEVIAQSFLFYMAGMAI